MKSMKLKGAAPLTVLGLLAFVSASVIQAQVTKEQIEAVGANLRAPQAFYHNLSPKQRKMLSGAALNFFQIVDRWPDLERQILAGQLPDFFPTPASSDIKTGPAPVKVSNPATDFVYGPSSGFTQSETSTAWCGNNVVVGFNDSGSYWESGFATTFAHVSLNGWSNSTNQGGSFTDRGYLPSKTANPFNFLEGDPVLACNSASTFYYSSLFFTATSLSSLTAISVSSSANGGVSFGAPVIAVSKSAVNHFLDKDWMAVDPARPTHIAVTYTDFDFSGTVCGKGIERTAIELVYSTNAGATWSKPMVVYQACDASPNFPSVQGSQVAFSPSGAVDVAFELFSGGVPTGNQIEFESAPALGAAFGATVAVANVTFVGDGFALQGGFRAFIDLQGMAIDHSNLTTKGNVYIVYHDATDFVKSFSGVGYGYADVMFTRSTNGGATWSAPVEVNTASTLLPVITEPLPSGRGIDSYMPGVAVDNTSGEIGVCWYDRRNDLTNLKVDRYCADSFTAGATFTAPATPATSGRMTPASFSPIHGTDDLINPTYMGDYDTVASDTLKTTPGFIGAFQVVVPASPGSCTSVPPCVLVPNSDVVARSFN